MTQRITTQMIDNTNIASINDDLTQLQSTEAELASQFRINQASDDPYGAAESLTLSAQISSYGNYKTNISTATSQVNTATSALQSIESIVESVRDLTVEGANGTSNSNDLQDEAAEVLSYINQIKTAANTQYDGTYIFSGTATTTRPYDDSTDGTDTYEGNTSSATVVIGPKTTISTSADLSSVLGGGTGSAGAYDSSTGEGGLLTTLRQVYTDMENGDTSALSSDLSSIDGCNDQLEELQSKVGATSNQLSMASSFITNVTTTATKQLGDVEDTDEATATVQFSTEENAFEAALKASAEIIQTSLLNYLSS